MPKKKSSNEPIEYIDSWAFDEAKEKIIGKSHNDKGIGTLSERHCMQYLKCIMSLMRIIMRLQ